MIPGWSVLQACLQHCKLPNVRFIQNLEGKKHNSIIFLWPVPLFLCLNSGNDGWSLKHTVHVCMRQGEERRNQGFKRALHRFIMMMTAAVCIGGPGLLFSSLLFHTVIFMVCVCPNCATTAAQIKKKHVLFTNSKETALSSSSFSPIIQYICGFLFVCWF